MVVNSIYLAKYLNKMHFTCVSLRPGVGKKYMTEGDSLNDWKLTMCAVWLKSRIEFLQTIDKLNGISLVQFVLETRE